MATLEVFWTPDEMAHWISELAGQYALRILVFPAHPDVDKPFWKDAPVSAVDIKNAFHIYLAPKADPHAKRVKKMGDVNQRGWGWMVVRGGGLYAKPERLLEKTEVIAEDRAAAPIKLAKCVAWLKRQVAKDPAFKTGARISWTHLPGADRDDHKVLSSQGARDAFGRGVLWVASRGSAMIRYAPPQPSTDRTA